MHVSERRCRRRLRPASVPSRKRRAGGPAVTRPRSWTSKYGWRTRRAPSSGRCSRSISPTCGAGLPPDVRTRWRSMRCVQPRSRSGRPGAGRRSRAAEPSGSSTSGTARSSRCGPHPATLAVAWARASSRTSSRRRAHGDIGRSASRPVPHPPSSRRGDSTRVTASRHPFFSRAPRSTSCCEPPTVPSRCRGSHPRRRHRRRSRTLPPRHPRTRPGRTRSERR